jgi:6-pyruvoyltetrahydropterin/6-carboxytetrahydropterin synthase
MTKQAIITKIFRFESAHILPDHNGKCSRLHGHSYKLEVSLRGKIKHASGESDNGMVLDFADLSRMVKEVIVDRLDHYNLNEVTRVYTTAENLVHWMWDELVRAGFPELLLYRVRLWETETAYAEITQAER